MKLLKMICFAVSPPVAAGRCLAAGPILAAIEAWSNSPAKVPCSKSDLCSGSIPCSGSLQWVQPLQRVPAIRSPGRKAILVYCMCLKLKHAFCFPAGTTFAAGPAFTQFLRGILTYSHTDTNKQHKQTLFCTCCQTSA